MKHAFLAALGAALIALASANLLPAGDTGEEKRAKLEDIADLPSLWIYDDIPAGIARAKAEKKPLLIVFR